MKSIFVILCFLLLGIGVNAENFNLSPQDYNDTAIVCDDNGAVASFASDELQKHLEFITGYRFPIVLEKNDYEKAFYIGVVPKEDKKPLKAEEARYLITPSSVYLYGEDKITVTGEDEIQTVTKASRNRTGTLFAVYNFLENELGVHWYEPGDIGIVYKRNSFISIPAKSSSWISHFLYQRGMRSGTANYEAFMSDKSIPQEFKNITAEQLIAKKAETDIWLKRMRMGNRSVYLPFSHAFSKWWETYGNEHPDWFAVNANGKRAPMGAADRIKMCVSNQDLVNHIVELYKERGVKGGAIDGTENDSAGYCICDKCNALGRLNPFDKSDANLTDRYVNFWNNIASEARKFDSKVIVTGFAYADMLNPPKKERLSNSIVIEVVSVFADDFKYTDSLFNGWKKMGMKQMIFRPNDLCSEIGLPMGQEKRIFEHQQMAIKYGALGTDHDSMFGLWTGVSGITYYILAKGHVDPSKSFEYWEDEYYSLYGLAKNDMAKYYRYWRNQVFEERLFPADQALRNSGKPGILEWSVVGEYARNIGEYYNEHDFDITDGFLKSALKKKLNPVQKKMVERLIVANEHSRLTYRAMLAAKPKSGLDSAKAAKTLLDFRVANKNNFNMNWSTLFKKQVDYGDVTGMAQASLADRKSKFDCIKINEQVKIDGLLNEEFWSKADTKTAFLVMPTSAEAKVQTQTYLAYDNENLYIAFNCLEDNMDKLREVAKDRDGAAYSDNAIELFLDPMRTGTDFMQIVISSAGVMYDGIKQNNKLYSPDWNWEIGKNIVYAVSKGQNNWIVEIQIPFKDSGIPTPPAGNMINFNLCRDRLYIDGSVDEYTSLAPLFAGFQTPSKFVTMVFK